MLGNLNLLISDYIKLSNLSLSKIKPTNTTASWNREKLISLTIGVSILLFKIYRLYKAL